MAIQRELLRRVIHDLRENTRDVDFASIERIIDLVRILTNWKTGGDAGRIGGGFISGTGLIIKRSMPSRSLFADQLWMPSGESIKIAMDGYGDQSRKFPDRIFL